MQKKKSDEDAELIRAYQQGDFRALNQLIGKYRGNYIFKVLRYKGLSAQASEDCTQDICMKLIDGLKRFRFECDFKAYLDRMINNKVIDYYRQKAREKKLFTSLDKQIDDEENKRTLLNKSNHASYTEDSEKLRELRQVIGSCLNKITNQKMRILLCLWLKGLKVREMAELLGIGKSDASVTLLRGKEKLRNCVARHHPQK
jgi:RNA polymerase sigma-70 factor (ECF subfamily)